MGKYIFLPNQYWAHKNHLTVIAALQLLKMQGEKVQLISTGLTEDYRNPNHFTNILRAVEAGGLGDLYKILGVIPYHDMASLMYHSQAVINPSLFEGWSTTVEEAKILEKRLLLSDIPVHREQAQDHALYFSPQSPSSCAQAIKTTWHANPVPVSPNYQQNAQAAAQEFCDNYCAILVEAMKLQQTFGRHS
jgi:glycosyltransferase involved in cell wall biosynthesis